jgi:hypothetical protein
MNHPYVEALEERRLFSEVLSSPALVFRTSPGAVGFGSLVSPRTSGIAEQTGSLLTVDLRNRVRQPGLDTVTVVDDGKGDIQASWDGGPVHSFSGVTQIVISSAPTQTDQITLQLNGPLTTPLSVQLNLSGINNTVTEEVGDNGTPPAGLDVSIDTLRNNGTTVVDVTP